MTTRKSALWVPARVEIFIRYKPAVDSMRVRVQMSFSSPGC